MDRHRSFLDQRYFPLLDGLRCLAILGVVWYHAAAPSYASGPLSRGFEGVSLFFVISGFLITTLLLREQSETGDISLRSFYLRRTLRIFPVYYGVLAFYALLVFLQERHSTAGAQFWHNLPFFMTYTSDWFVNADSDRVIFLFSWSLATEEQFYLFWPWIIRSARGRHSHRRHGPAHDRATVRRPLSRRVTGYDGAGECQSVYLRRFAGGFRPALPDELPLGLAGLGLAGQLPCRLCCRCVDPEIRRIAVMGSRRAHELVRRRLRVATG
jgi:hypothetical protein